jgi:hypothetical protein
LKIINTMAPSAVLSKLRGNRNASSKQSYDHTSLPPLQTSAQDTKLDASLSAAASKSIPPSLRVLNLSESPSDEFPASRMTALPRFSDEWHQHRPFSATSERSSPGANGAISSVASKAHNFVFSLQPPRRFTTSLTPNDSPVRSPNTGAIQVYSDRVNSNNLSTSSLSVAEDAVSHKSGSSRLGKAKFNLLNPLSLLARRRSSQNQPSKAEDGNQVVNTLDVRSLPDDYDPRIRGNIVHDFSIPKARRLNSYTGISSAETSPSIDSRPSTQGNRRGSEQLPPFGSFAGRTPQTPAHSPLFKEHFNDDRLPIQPQNTGYPHTLATPPAIQSSNDPPRLPAFPKSLPLDIFGKDHLEKNAETAKIDPSASSGQLSVISQPLPEDLPQANSSQTPAPSTNSVPPSDKQLAPAPDFLRPNEILPKHTTSTSSRFSFQLSGIDSEAQERLLEEKHKQHVGFRSLVGKYEEDVDSEDDQYGDADFDDDGLEEKIPGVNADLDDELEESPEHQSTGSFHFIPRSVELSLNNLIPGSQPTPRDGEVQVIGLAQNKSSPNPGLLPSGLELDPRVLEQSPWSSGLGLAPLGDPGSHVWTGIVQQLPPQSEDLQEDIDDLYFDDGNFDSLEDVVDGDSFDEELFDDETGKIHNIPAQNARKLELAQQQNPGQLSESGTVPQWEEGVSTDETCQEPILPLSADLEVLTDASGDEDQQQEASTSPPGQGNGLTEDNLAYQNALVSAANKAAAQGRFSRHLSMSQESEQIVESQPGLISDDSRISRLVENTVAEDEPEDFLFDDNLEDDPMVAEANAEVLENDDEGFYGQEFGFYARAHSNGHAEMVNGGYFGPKGVEGVHRSHSSKANFQEPSLTPITERSEWSHRNSVASLHTLGLPPSAQAVPSPGIAELLDLDPSSLEDDMSLSALMRLRRGAWGGSQTSLNSTGGSQAASSPLAQPPLRDSFGSQSAGFENEHLNSGGSARYSYQSTSMFPEVFEEEGAHQNSNAHEVQATPPVMLLNESPQQAVPDPPSHLGGLSQTSHALDKAGKGHSRASSGAESVSYVRDPEGSGRWLLERRRTGDDGEVELVGREYVAGARI